MEVILLSDVDKVGLRGEVVNVARGYARNFLLPRRLAEPATPGRVAELKRLDDQRARHEARSVEQANEIADVLRKTVLSFDVKAGPTGRALRLGDDDRHRRRALAHAQDPRRPEEDRHRLDPADRPLRGPDPDLRGRHRRGEDARRPRGRRAAARGGAGRDGGGRGRGRGGQGGRGRGAPRRGRGDPRGRDRRRGGHRGPRPRPRRREAAEGDAGTPSTTRPPRVRRARARAERKTFHSALHRPVERAANFPL